MRIIQVLPVLAYGDAIGNDTLAIARMLTEENYENAIYAEAIDPRLPSGIAKPFSSLPPLNKNDILLYHGSTGSGINILLASLSGIKVMIYHNITPASFFQPYNKEAYKNMRIGYQQLCNLKNTIQHCIAASDFNKRSLLEMGYTCPIDVCPIVIPFNDYDQAPSPDILNKYSNDNCTNWLFVGRVSPNKKHEDVIRSFYYYRNNKNKCSRLIFVGNEAGMERYAQRLKNYVQKLGLSDSVIFSGHVRFNEILAYYQTATVFVCMSEHEGFCVPLVEAMHFKLPIVAYDSTAVPDTLGSGGILSETKDPRLIAEYVNTVLENTQLKNAIIDAQNKQISKYQYNIVKQRFLHILQGIVDSVS